MSEKLSTSIMILHQEIRNTLRKGLGTMSQEQQEIVLNKMLSPSEKQLRGVSPTGKNLLEQRAEANEQAMGSMRLSDEEREKESMKYFFLIFTFIEKWTISFGM